MKHTYGVNEQPGIPTSLLCNRRDSPIGVGAAGLRFSWTIGGERIRRQSAYQILVAADLGDLRANRGTMWDSGKTDGSEMAHILYEGAPLEAQTYYYWKIRIWDDTGTATDYSDHAVFATGIDGPWQARWIWTDKSPEPDSGSDSGIEPNNHVYLRKEVALAPKPVKRIVACVSADDMYKLYVNGSFVGQGPCPSYPDIGHNYNGYELLPFFKSGQPLCIAVHAYYQGLVNNALVSGDGRAGWIAQIRVVYEDGTDEIIGTDETWRAKRSEAYGWTRKLGYDTGFDEQIDARAEPQGWKEAGYSDEAWERASVQDGGKWKLFAQETDVLHVEEQEPKQITELPDGVRFDMGKEIVGMLRLVVEGRAGDRVEIRLGEELDEAGSVRFDMRCNCVYRDVWTIRDGVQTIEFYDYRAFRYGEVIVLSDTVTLRAVRAVVRHYPFDDTAASFRSSDGDLNALWDISAYSTKVGTQELYMDCPSREKANYSLDTYLEMSAAYYVAGEWNLSRSMIGYFLQSDPDGKLRCMAPAGRPHYFTEYTMYPVLMAWRYYEYTGDKPFLAAQYASLCRVHRYMTTFADESGLLTRTNDTLCDLVDWPVNMRDGHEMLPVNIVPNAVYYGMTTALAGIAAAIGRSEDADAYAKSAASLKRMINSRFWNGTIGAYCDGLDGEGRPSVHSSLHSNAFALALGLVPAERTEPVLRHIRSRGMRCNLFLAMFLFEALFDYGEADYALELLKADGEYSPMNMIRQGATTTWEAWDLTQKANASLCHPAGAFTAYLIGSRVMGVMPAEPGFAKVRIRPQTGKLRNASIRVPTPRGAVELAIEQAVEMAYTMELQIPSNTTADAYVPLPRPHAADCFVLVNGVRTQVERHGVYLLLRDVPCGRYRIEAKA
ncbi:family 78 glycoside hydrolase catalytic domain [Paenibacillus mesophilus]|uniref:family 78 glycoside hydrolase catalytic domain n=1 Tax=Paenibacillus mesophilus TaxID=2582849 RepID=UPI001EE451E0|nr:family 78 glycoside hydrolase catalytic domain [Paenibacillus mesophilus]